MFPWIFLCDNPEELERLEFPFECVFNCKMKLRLIILVAILMVGSLELTGAFGTTGTETFPQARMIASGKVLEKRQVCAKQLGNHWFR